MVGRMESQQHHVAYDAKNNPIAHATKQVKPTKSKVFLLLTTGLSHR